MNSSLYLGEMIFEGKKFTRVEPLALARDGAWRTGQDWKKVLPNEGLAFAPSQPPFHRGDAFAFETVPNTRSDKDRDLHIVSTWTAVEEVLDFRDGHAEAARRLLVEVGVKVIAQGTTQIVVALPGGVCVVVKMERGPASPLFLARLDGLAALPLHKLDERVFDGDPVRGRLYSVPGTTIGPQIDTTNWSRDADFLETVLKRLRKVSAAGEPTTSLSRIGPLTTYLARAALTPALGADLEPMRARLASVAATLDINVAAVGDIVDLVSSFRPVTARLEADMAERRDTLEAELRAELEGNLKAEAKVLERELSMQRARFESEVADFEALSGLARAEAAEATTARDELRAALRDELLALEGGLEAPPGGEAEARELVARVSRRLRARGLDVEPAPDETPPWARVRLQTHAEGRPWSEAAAALETAARRFGYSSVDLFVADAAARSGAVVVLPESEASQFVRCHATAMACGDLVRQALDPAVLSLDDLWRQPSTGKPTAFASAWTSARLDARRYRVVLLDGLQRTPLDLWLPSLIEVLQGPMRPRNLLVFATLGVGGIDAARMWRGIDSEVIPIRPVQVPGLSAEVLATAAGTGGPVTCFDAEAVPTPSRAELLAFADDYPGDLDPKTLRRVVGVLRAAWALAPAVAPVALAHAFAPDLRDNEGFGGPLAFGAGWLRSITSTWD